MIYQSQKLSTNINIRAADAIIGLQALYTTKLKLSVRSSFLIFIIGNENAKPQIQMKLESICSFQQDFFNSLV